MDRRERIISENIRAARIKHKLTQEEFSEEIGISTNFLYKIEAGTAHMSLQTLLRIQEVLNLDGNVLLGLKETSGVTVPGNDLKQILPDCGKKEIESVLKLLDYIKRSLEDSIS